MDAESDMEQNWFPLYPGDHYVDRGLLDTRSWGSEVKGELVKEQVDPVEDTTATSPVEFGSISLWDPPPELGQTPKWNMWPM